MKYQDLSKEELVRILMRVNKRLTRVNRELQEIIGILYYGGEGSQNRGQYGRRRREEVKEDVNYE